MLLIIVMTTVVIVGLPAIALAEPRHAHEIVVWNDEAERRLLRDRKFNAGWW
ncbi:MAG TPA: hypothetical protein VGU66_10140 [Candidatus Elarobacter sp.]|nr:hypothetical protein [Candidatus Elarobacter sp.]